MPNQGNGPYDKYEGNDWNIYDASGNLVLTIEGDNRKIVVPAGVTWDIAGKIRLSATSAALLGLGAAETPTIASGVLTVTKPFVNPQPESSTTDTVDSIVYTGASAGDLLLIHVPATNTITFDDANINLGGATRAVAPGGSLLLVYDGTEWSEVIFLAASDNA